MAGVDAGGGIEGAGVDAGGGIEGAGVDAGGGIEGAGEGLEDLAARIRRLEDEAAIRRLVSTYGPAADAGLAARAAGVWLEEGEYDWDGGAPPYLGRSAVQGMLEGETHQGIIGGGAAHFAGPALIDLDGDRATALTYSLVMRYEADSGRFYLWRVSAARWDLERDGASWGVRRRTNRLLDGNGAGRTLFGEALGEIFGEEAR
jgi:hypothetical protein